MNFQVCLNSTSSSLLSGDSSNELFHDPFCVVHVSAPVLAAGARPDGPCRLEDGSVLLDPPNSQSVTNLETLVFSFLRISRFDEHWSLFATREIGDRVFTSKGATGSEQLPSIEDPKPEQL